MALRRRHMFPVIPAPLFPGFHASETMVWHTLLA